MYSRITLATALVVVSSTFVCAQDPVEPGDEVQPRDIEVGEITLKIPAAWKKSEPTSKLRLAQFAIPKAEGDAEAAELAIFSFGGGGGVQANIDRWIAQFEGENRKSKVTTGRSELGQYVMVDVQGTYKKPVGPPVLRKTEPLKDARMLAVILGVEGKGNYFLKMTGQEKTVSEAAQAFRDAFGGNEDREEKLAPE